MKYLFTSLFISFLYISVSAQEISQPEVVGLRSNFELTIENISEVKGEIRIAVFNSENTYNEKKKPSHAVVLPVTEKSITWSDSDLPYGEYAIAVYHDKNENGKLDANLLRIPKEDYGFSNNARGRFGPASWKDAHFKVNEPDVSMTIQIK